jgi:hypothetical protein
MSSAWNAARLCPCHRFEAACVGGGELQDR